MAAITLPSETQSSPALRLCRFCRAPLTRTFVDFGTSPLCESYPSAADLNRGEVFYPLHVYVCESCFLVQLEEYESAENIFSDYAYFSSYSDSWLKHAEDYCEKMTHQFGLKAGVLWSKLQATMAIFCSISFSEMCRCWGSSRLPTSRMWRSKKESRR